MTTTTATPPKVPAGDPIPDRHRPNAGLLVETFDITPYAGPKLLGSLFRAQGRRTGRRIRVHAPATGQLLFDTEECYDQGNATHALEAWLDAYHFRLAEVMPEVSPIFVIWDAKGLAYWGFNEFVPGANRCYRFVSKAHAEAVLSSLRMCHPLRQLDILTVERPPGLVIPPMRWGLAEAPAIDAQPAGGSIVKAACDMSAAALESGASEDLQYAREVSRHIQAGGRRAEEARGRGMLGGSDPNAGANTTYQRAIDAGLLVRCDHCGEEVPQTPGGQAAGDSQQIIDGVFCEPCTKKLADRAELARLADDGNPHLPAESV